ncbi:MAG: DUF72 domain-containing protein [Gemmatimonadetes bacterium]|nr:DUF72 domain-containing protein [Gemmatimonadota bacterium]
MAVQLSLFDGSPEPGAVPVGPAPVGAELAEAAARLPRSLRMGTSSWSFPGWEGLVYDRSVQETVLARHGLAAYARHPLLRTVGVDRTFYRSLPAAEFRAMADVVPEEFRFLVKADRLVTSATDPGEGPLRGAIPRFLDAAWAIDKVVGPVVEGLGPKAGPLLFQFPPTAPNLVGGSTAFVERLHRFLDALPPGPLYAVELRTPAFLTGAYAEVLESTRAAHCYTVHPSMPPLEQQIAVVRHFEQPALVVRWMLHSGLRYEAAKDRYEPFDRIVDEDPRSLDSIAVAVLDALIAERAAFVVVNNKAEGSAPRSVFRLALRIADWDLAREHPGDAPAGAAPPAAPEAVAP